MRLSVVLLALVLGVGACASNAVTPSADPTAVAAPCRGVACPERYAAPDLSTATERLLAASRAGEVPEISFVRNRVDERGLVVAVPRAVFKRYGAERLSQTYTDAVQVPATIEVAHPPSDGLLPIRPVAPGASD